MKNQTEYSTHFSFVVALILCLLFFLASHIITRELTFKLINSEVSSRIDSVVQLQTNLILERIQQDENVLQSMFQVYELKRVKRGTANLKSVCNAIEKQCSIKKVTGPPGLPGLVGQKGSKGDDGLPGFYRSTTT